MKSIKTFNGNINVRDDSINDYPYNFWIVTGACVNPKIFDIDELNIAIAYAKTSLSFRKKLYNLFSDVNIEPRTELPDGREPQ